MEMLALIAAVGCAGAILGFLLLRRRRPRKDFLNNPNDWGW